MGWYFKKSIKIGAARLNFSKSGIGASIGFKGARLSVGPKGTYVSLGRGGVYYRQKIASNSNKQNNTLSEHGNKVINNHELEVIKTANIEELRDSKFEDLLNEINDKFKIPEYSKIAAGAVFLVFLILVINKSIGIAMLFSLIISLVIIPLKKIDIKNKKIILDYDLDSEAIGIYEQFKESFKDLKNCNRIWRINAQGATNDWKRNAGASNLVKRSQISIIDKPPKFMETNIEIFQLNCGKQVLCFLPNVILIYEGKKVGAIAYESLKVDIGNTRFIESESAPSDGEIVGKTWLYVNKNGTPDKRFSNNKQLPIMLYGEIVIKSVTGLNIYVNTSDHNATRGFKSSMDRLIDFLIDVKSNGFKS